MPDTRNLGPQQKRGLFDLEERMTMLLYLGPTPPGTRRYVWTGGGEVVKSSTVESLFDRGLVALDYTGRGGDEQRVVLTEAGLKWVAAYYRVEHGRCQRWSERLRERVKELRDENQRLRTQQEARS